MRRTKKGKFALVIWSAGTASAMISRSKLERVQRSIVVKIAQRFTCPHRDSNLDQGHCNFDFASMSVNTIHWNPASHHPSWRVGFHRTKLFPDYYGQFLANRLLSFTQWNYSTSCLAKIIALPASVIGLDHSDSNCVDRDPLPALSWIE